MSSSDNDRFLQARVPTFVLLSTLMGTKDSNDVLAGVLRKHEQEVRAALSQTSDWRRAAGRFDTFFGRMADPNDSLWSRKTIEKLTGVYLGERGDYQSGNITLRTVAAMPVGLRMTQRRYSFRSRKSVRFSMLHTR